MADRSAPPRREAEVHPEDPVAVASDESFPASDPPAFNATHAGTPASAAADPAPATAPDPRATAGEEPLPASLWMEARVLPAFGILDGESTADVVVVGVGVTGLTTACLLAEAGASVVVLDRGRLARVDSGHTTAHLTMVTDARLSGLVRSFGDDHAQAVWDAGLAALAEIERLVAELDIDCDFETVPGFLHLRPADDPAAPRADEAGELRTEAEIAEELGFDAAFEPAVPLHATPGVRFERQARIHPLRYLAGLARAAVERGVRIREDSGAERFHEEPLRVDTRRGSVSCAEVVVATHNPLVGVAGSTAATLLQTKLALYTSYVVAGYVPRGVVPDALFWDTGEPYRYLRLQPDGERDLVILGGEDHKTGQETDTRDRYARLEAALAATLPGVELCRRWSGQVIETPDGLPFIGPIAERQFVATGFGGNGLTFGTLAARMAADRFLGRRNPWSGLFAVERKAIRRGIWRYLTENADYPYYLLRDRFAGAEGRSLRSVPRGQGRVVELRGQKVAAFRDDRGRLTVRSAICTHLGCVVAWNDAERTWDCPCHGSRFHPDGRVISGPAESPLDEVGPRPGDS